MRPTASSIGNSAMFAHAEQGDDLYLPRYIRMKQPPMGVKILAIEERGTFVLERGPGALHGIACTHAGSGGYIVYDGVPDDRGYFPFAFEDEDFTLHPEFDRARIEANEPEDRHYIAECEEVIKRERHDYNGRRIVPFYSVVMGMWMFNGGLHHGLTIINKGEMLNVNPIITVTWSALRKQYAQVGLVVMLPSGQIVTLNQRDLLYQDADGRFCLKPVTEEQKSA